MKFEFITSPINSEPIAPESAEDCRERADRARELAAAAIDPATVEMLRDEAEDLDDMADFIETETAEDSQTPALATTDQEPEDDVDPDLAPAPPPSIQTA